MYRTTHLMILCALAGRCYCSCSDTVNLLAGDLEEFELEEQFFFGTAEKPEIETSDGLGWNEWFKSFVWKDHSKVSSGSTEFPAQHTHNHPDDPHDCQSHHRECHGGHCVVIERKGKAHWSATNIILLSVLVALLIGTSIIAGLYFRTHPELDHPTGRKSA
uniref:Uncharacterized protein n=1 Tax=Paramoeba aestuarina TaxID=180227 RepID=A0A7S4P1G2_9EUKA